MSRLFGTDGIRGLVGKELTPALAHAVGRALGLLLGEQGRPAPTVLIGHDTRASCRGLVAALTAGLSSVGTAVTLLGVLPTPAVSHLVLSRGADAGVVVSASHNPAEYNGIKIFGRDGTKLSDVGEERIEALLGDEGLAAAPVSIATPTDPTGAEEYLAALAATVDTPLAPLRLAADCANGAAVATAPRLLARLGLAPLWLGAAPDGTNINKECGSTSLSRLSATVLEHRLDLGIAFDGDADRCLLIDERGATVDGDAILCMCALDRHRRGLTGSRAVVGTVMSNLGLSRRLEREGIAFHAAPVGDRFVAETMKRVGATLGGEPSGHVIFSDVAATGDGLFTALSVLSLLTRSGTPLSALAAELARYPAATADLPLTPTAREALATDGELSALRERAAALLGTHGRLLIRPSGTEPRLRVLVEADNQALLESTLSLLTKEAERILEKY